MWKRILVLVLFLFGVFWWLTNRDADPVDDTVDPNTEVEVSVDEDGDTEDGEADNEESDDDETGDEDEDSDEDESGEVEAAVETETQVETTTKNTAATTTPQTATTVVTKVVTPVAPVVVVPEPDPIPAVVSSATVYLYEWGLDMNQKTFPAGTINFTVQNDGRFTHDFSVEGIGNLGKVTPSMTETFSAEFRPGQYEVFSDRREDYERGVRDMITVE